MVLSDEPDTTVASSGATAIEKTLEVWPSNVAIHFWVSKSQILIVLSCEPEMIVLPSRVIPSANTPPEWPFNSQLISPLGSHIRITPSSAPKTTQRLLGVTATDFTAVQLLPITSAIISTSSK